MHGLVLLSGGIDSPVAAALMLQKKVKLSAVFFDAWPFSDREQIDKVKQLVGQLEKYYSTKIDLYSIPHKESLTEIGRCCFRKLGCVLCRRIMLRTASEFGRKEGMEFLVTGESLGQVASQTLSNIRTENPASSLFIMRPLIGFDKIEIESKAKEIGTYTISIQPGMCCTMAPKYPVTKANLSRIMQEESKLDLNFLMKKALENTKKLI